MGEPVVVTAMRQFKAGLLAGEERQQREMARRWLMVEVALEPHILSLTWELEEQRSAGMVVSRAKMLQLARYRRLMVQAQVEIERYAQWAAGEVTAGQARMARLGIDHAAEAIGLSYPPGGAGVSFTRLPADAVQGMVGIAGDGAPVGDLLRRRMVRDENGAPLPGVWDRLTNALTEGAALGWGPERTARRMRDGLAEGLQKALVIARTEQMRVYREAQRAQYEASGVVTGHKRVCAHDARVCPACLADDGHVYPVDVAIPDHPNGRCTSVPVVTGVAEPVWEAGEAWLRGQGEDVARSVLGRYYDGWVSHQFGLDDLLVRTEHPIWGPGLGVRSLRELLEEIV